MSRQVSLDERAIDQAGAFLADDPDALRAVLARSTLSEHPYPDEAFPFGSTGLHRLRVGPDRVLYTVPTTSSPSARSRGHAPRVASTAHAAGWNVGGSAAAAARGRVAVMGIFRSKQPQWAAAPPVVPERADLPDFATALDPAAPFTQALQLLDYYGWTMSELIDCMTPDVRDAVREQTRMPEAEEYARAFAALAAQRGARWPPP